MAAVSYVQLDQRSSGSSSSSSSSSGGVPTAPPRPVQYYSKNIWYDFVLTRAFLNVTAAKWSYRSASVLPATLVTLVAAVVDIVKAVVSTAFILPPVLTLYHYVNRSNSCDNSIMYGRRP